MAGMDDDCRVTIEDMMVTCQRLLTVFEQYGYPKDPEFLKGVSFLTGYMIAEIDLRRWVGEMRNPEGVDGFIVSF
jgi:chemotaxis signal transduction protein